MGVDATIGTIKCNRLSRLTLPTVLSLPSHAPNPRFLSEIPVNRPHVIARQAWTFDQNFIREVTL